MNAGLLIPQLPAFPSPPEQVHTNKPDAGVWA